MAAQNLQENAMKRTCLIFLTTLFMLLSCARTESIAKNETDTAVIYFSATGNTKRIAERTNDLLNADLIRINPEKPYSEEDLNYSNSESRANIEMDDPDSRPEIEAIGELARYKRVFLGFPIWWGEAPRIINTFIESNDLEGKAIYLFATSGSSSIARSLKELRELYPELDIRDGMRFSSSSSDSIISDWLKTL